jgi:hypothetical protein
MSQAHLNSLERDVEQSRQRFADDLARIRSPDILTSFKDNLWAATLDKTAEATKDTAQRVLHGLKERALANPAAALAIGAGLVWRFAHRPPIATLLVGIGLASLLRASPSQQSSQPHMESSAEETGNLSQPQKHAALAKQKVQEWSEDATTAIRRSMTQATDKAATMAERASDVFQETSAAARKTATQIADKTSLLAERAADVVRDASSDQNVRDKILLGAATLAVTAAIGVAYQRRAHEHNQLSR